MWQLTKPTCMSHFNQTNQKTKNKLFACGQCCISQLYVPRFDPEFHWDVGGLIYCIYCLCMLSLYTSWLAILDSPYVTMSECMVPCAQSSWNGLLIHCVHEATVTEFFLMNFYEGRSKTIIFLLETAKVGGAVIGSVWHVMWHLASASGRWLCRKVM